MEKFERVEKIRAKIEQMDYTPVTGDALQRLQWRTRQSAAKEQSSISESGSETYDAEKAAFQKMLVEVGATPEILDFATKEMVKDKYGATYQ